MAFRRIGITWMPSNSHGWGVFGLNLAVNLIRNGPTYPILLCKPMLYDPPKNIVKILNPFINESSLLMKKILSSNTQIVLDDATLIHALSDNFKCGDII